MSDADISKALSLIEKLHWKLALCDREVNTSEIRALGIEAITFLNTILKTPDLKEKVTFIRQVCQDAIALYQSIKENKGLNYDDKLKWISSSVKGQIYPPLLYKDYFIRQESSSLNDNLPLSKEQNESLDHWSEVIEQDWSLDGINHIYQDYLQDCSFVAAFISLSRENSNLLHGAISPHSNTTNFAVALNFNGTRRIVEVNNKLPVLKSKSLFVRSKTNKDLFWPAFIEKAYLKIRGNGYDPQGSNASIDTFILSGWLPDYITKVDRPDMDLLWDKLFNDFKENKVLLTVGTDEFSKEYYPNHDYVIVDMVDESYTVLIKNPWKNDISFVKFTELFDYFETLYLNWNTNGVQHSSLNFIWKKVNKHDSLFHYPQFHIHNSSSKSTEVSVLVEKHIHSEELTINVLIYKTNYGEKVFSKQKQLIRTIGNNTGFHLTKFLLTADEHVTIVVLNDAENSQTFTIHAFARDDIRLEKAKLLFTSLKTIDDAWDIDSCGGNWSYQSYTKNPQYQLVVPEHHESVSVVLGLFTDSNVLINMRLYWDDDKPFSNKASLINEKYHAGALTKQIELTPGQIYKLVPSTHEPDTLAEFKLLVNSSIPVSIERISTRLGVFTTSFKFNWNNKNRFKLRFEVSRSTKVSIHLWSDTTNSNYRPKIRASLFYKNGRPIVINSDFDDNLYGIWIQKATVEPVDEVVLLIERFEVGNGVVFGEIGSDLKVNLV